MKVKVPTPEEYRKARRRKVFRTIGGFLIGIFLSLYASARILKFGLDAIETYTWVLLAIPPVYLAVLAWLYGEDFWTMFRKQSNY